MNKFFLFFIIFLPVPVFANTFIKTEIKWHTLQYIEYNNFSDTYDIKIGISDSWNNLRNITNNYWWVTALNGIFFCPSDYPQCKGKNYTINERFVSGKEISTYKSTWERVIFWWNKEKITFLHQTNKINTENRKDIYEWFANFPLLLQWWKNKLEHYYDVGLIDKKMRIKIERHFICSDKKHEKILFWQVFSATLDDVVGVIKAIGCWDAINLDAGKSSAFIYNGRYIYWPWRDILDSVIITRKDLDITSLNTKIKTFFQKIEESYFKKRNRTTAIKKLKRYRKNLAKIRVAFYKKYSKDILNDKWKIIGYKIDIQKKRALKKIYIINTIDFYIWEIIKKL